MDQVNARSPENERFEVLWWYPGKYPRFERDCARIFPESKPRSKERTLLVIGAVGLLDDFAVADSTVRAANSRLGAKRGTLRR